MGAALLLLYERARDIFEKDDQRNTKMNLENIANNNEQRVKAINDTLLGDSLDWPSSVVLREAAATDLGQVYSKLWLLRSDNKCWGTQKRLDVPLRGGGMECCVFVETGDADASRFGKVWGLILQPDGMWQLRGSRFAKDVDNSYGWTLCHTR
jgi:hypothetical protein